MHVLLCQGPLGLRLRGIRQCCVPFCPSLFGRDSGSNKAAIGFKVRSRPLLLLHWRLLLLLWLRLPQRGRQRSSLPLGRSAAGWRGIS
jgi:hypothetical protein